MGALALQAAPVDLDPSFGTVGRSPLDFGYLSCQRYCDASNFSLAATTGTAAWTAASATAAKWSPILTKTPSSAPRKTTPRGGHQAAIAFDGKGSLGFTDR
jgi:hypothetical protein